MEPENSDTNKPSGTRTGFVGIFDIRNDSTTNDIKDQISKLLEPKQGLKKLPTVLLYDLKGLQLFEKITHLDEYYLTNAEIDILNDHAKDMAAKIPNGAMIIELGSGSLRKVRLLIDALEASKKDIDYYALDLSREELERTFAELPVYQHVTCHGLWGTYDDGKEWLRRQTERPKVILHLGASIGNFERHEATEFLGSFADILHDQDSLLVGIDLCQSPNQVFHAYNDSKGITHEFILNGLAHVNTIFGADVFHLPDWKVIGEYVYDGDGGRHQAFVMPVRNVEILGRKIAAYERLQIEKSLKYDKDSCGKLWKAAGLEETHKWTITDTYGVYRLRRRRRIHFPLSPSLYASSSVPTLNDWTALWAVWDLVTCEMLAEKDLLGKPIKLRNACVFYLGHIPVFLDIQLKKVTGVTPTHLDTYYSSIFERGIDPDVDNPENCHDHSTIPENWPAVDDILAYQNRVRASLASFYEHGVISISRQVGRAIWLGFEHEIMHVETILYMMLQSPSTLPPPHTARPDFREMAKEALERRVENKWFDVPAQRIRIGMDDPEHETDTIGYFGWDNEKPPRSVNVHAFQAKGRPITNEEYAEYLFKTNSSDVPASWSYMTLSDEDDYDGHSSVVSSSASVLETFFRDKAVRTVYGNVPLSLALDWPVIASYDELVSCATWMGGRIPTYEETRSIYEYADKRRQRISPERESFSNISMANSDGSEELSPCEPAISSKEKELFVDLTNSNVGLQHWHPISVTHHGNKLSGQGEMGGAWEWTSTPLSRHDGFQPMAMYPAYTTDFFDGKHNIVLGGSWATHPRIAGRKSFVNWYQRKYRFAWTGARLVRDI